MKTFLKKVGLIGIVVGLVAVFAVIEAWTFMIVLGILWGEFGWLAPIGLLPAFGLVTLGAGALGILGRAWRSDGASEKYVEVIASVVPEKPAVTNIFNSSNN